MGLKASPVILVVLKQIPSLFYGTKETFYAVYVDDVLIAGPSKAMITELKQDLDNLFTIKDLGVAKYFLGLEIARSSKWQVAGNQISDPWAYGRLAVVFGISKIRYFSILAEIV
ncbi:UNVERIFIED_CONTAM: hypothetical protein Sradi_6111200 [Sesamum radiatum]|uniref:Reverse transcriptase Ty1/copia-type domain-containing protein n=1 Tax=Sesamum radiatum TaxID=300843 RepID=A0AAW2KKU1_SESRA